MATPKVPADLSSLSPWKLETAKARFSELLQRARESGPQRVTVQGRDAVVVLSAEDYRRMAASAAPTAPTRSLFDVMQAMPTGDFDFTSPAVRAPLRDIEL